jgi:hypothetical protein
MKRIIFATLICILVLGPSISTAQAAECQDTYTVEYGDYLTKIASNYEGINFLDIAQANDIEAPYVLLPGQKLCIPEKAVSRTTTSGTTTVTSRNFTIRKRGDTLRVSVENLQRSETYFVKVDDANKNGLVWYKVGLLKTDRNREGEGTFTLPDALQNASAFTVCLKNVSTDDLICSDPGLTRYVEEEDEEEGSTDKATFTVIPLTGDRIMISTSRFPTDSFWLVKVRVWGGDIQNWSEVGKLRTRDQTSARYIYDLPSRFRNEDNLYICLKNQVTNEAKCAGISR